MIQKDKLIAQINAKDIKGFRTLYEPKSVIRNFCEQNVRQ